jgi:hypothetical protein
MLKTFSTEEYADMVFILGVCDGNATDASTEYRGRYLNRRIPLHLGMDEGHCLPKEGTNM